MATQLSVTCGYVGCSHTAVAQVRQTIGKRQALPVCQVHKDRLLAAWAQLPAALQHMPVYQVMEELQHES